MNIKKIKIIHYWSVLLLMLAYTPLVFICMWLDRVSPVWGIVILVTGIILYAISLFLMAAISENDKVLMATSEELEQKFREQTDRYSNAADEYIAAKNTLVKFILEKEKEGDQTGSSSGTEKAG